jgi:hypothetical protein
MLEEAGFEERKEAAEWRFMGMSAGVGPRCPWPPGCCVTLGLGFSDDLVAFYGQHRCSSQTATEKKG